MCASGFVGIKPFNMSESPDPGVSQSKLETLAKSLGIAISDCFPSVFSQSCLNCHAAVSIRSVYPPELLRCCWCQSVEYTISYSTFITSFKNNPRGKLVNLICSPACFLLALFWVVHNAVCSH